MTRRKNAAATLLFTPMRAAALRHLFEAHKTALELGRTPGDFACELSSLERHGITETVLRWLMAKKLVKHRLETTRPSRRRRTFREPKSMRFVDASCFLLTARGARLAETIADENGLNQPTPEAARPRPAGNAPRPHYDCTLRTLFLGHKVVKRFRVRAPNQEIVLRAFEEDGWPPQIDDPHPRSPGIEPRQRLRDTIKRLNRHQQEPLIRFSSDGTGRGIRWSLR